MMMHAGEREPVLALHGRLAGPEVAEFERIAATAPLPLRIDLENLIGVDALGLGALRAQGDRGAHLTKASPYVRLLLETAGVATVDL
jgi:hypothetical protein